MARTMTPVIWVTEPWKNNAKRYTKPQRVLSRYAESDKMLHHLIREHPEAIYFFEDPEDFDPPARPMISESMNTEHEVWSWDKQHPDAPPTPFRQDLGSHAIAKAYANGFNNNEADRGRYEFLPVRVTTTRKYEVIR